MRGGPDDAERGSLGFYLGGSDPAVARIRKILDALGEPGVTHRVGDDVASAHTAKLLANNLWFTHVVAVTESLLLASALGLDIGALRAAIESGPGGSSFFSDDLPNLMNGDYAESFGIDRVVEELDTLEQLAAAMGMPHRLASVVAQTHRDASRRFGAVDGEMLAAKLPEQRAGRRLRDR